MDSPAVGQHCHHQLSSPVTRCFFISQEAQRVSNSARFVYLVLVRIYVTEAGLSFISVRYRIFVFVVQLDKPDS